MCFTSLLSFSFCDSSTQEYIVLSLITRLSGYCNYWHDHIYSYQISYYALIFFICPCGYRDEADVGENVHLHVQ